MSFARVLVFGGTGFVGSRVVQQLAQGDGDVAVVSCSRSGSVPTHLAKEAWVSKVKWVAADELDPSTYKQWLGPECALVLTTSPGKPPMPTFSEESRKQQALENGLNSLSPINAAEENGVNHIVIVGATLPSWAPSGYKEGKDQAEERVKGFVAAATGRTGVVVKPTGIYGEKFHKDGSSINLGLFMAPIAAVMRGMYQIGVTEKLESLWPSAFENTFAPLVPVEDVASAVVAGLQGEKFRSRFSEITWRDLVDHTYQ
mmetsp:Transcript_22878/g.40541  ORF Transcript_22878/g.40541 Transcript_22878/m.40541 type:complete len:258 (-) Transcript_22878:116-889(-)